MYWRTIWTQQYLVSTYLMPSCAQALKLSSNCHSKIGFLPFPQNMKKVTFAEEISAFIEDLSVVASDTSGFHFLKEAGRKEIMVLGLARSWLPFLSNFLVARYIYHPSRCSQCDNKAAAL